MYKRDFLVSIPKTFRENAVELSLPNYPAIFFPLNTLEGSSLLPIEPIALCVFEFP